MFWMCDRDRQVLPRPLLYRNFAMIVHAHRHDWRPATEELEREARDDLAPACGILFAVGISSLIWLLAILILRVL